jgi:F0F1-type ATP synthase membrane subunit b/b'
MVVFGGGSPRSMLVYGIVSIAILAFTYFVIIKPITDSTNDTVNNALNQANHQINRSFHQANQTQRQVNHAVNKAQRQANQALAGQ